MTVGRRSAGLLLYRHAENGALEVLIAHMGGPFWAHKDSGAWSIPKGEYEPSEDPLQAARREFAEELGLPAPRGQELHLGSVPQRSGKVIDIWALPGDLEVGDIHPGTFQMRWPPGSERLRCFPEVDRAGWFDTAQARDKLTPGQVPFLDELERLLG